MSDTAHDKKDSLPGKSLNIQKQPTPITRAPKAEHQSDTGLHATTPPTANPASVVNQSLSDLMAMIGDQSDDFGTADQANHSPAPNHLATPNSHAALPPVHRWDPPSCGDIGLAVGRDGTWTHQGDAIERPALVKLFASLLKRDPNGDYWVVTPVEKSPVRVTAAPLLAVALTVEHPGQAGQTISLITNMGDTCTLGPDNPVRIDDTLFDDGPAPLVTVRHGPTNGIEALMTRSCFYDFAQCVEDADTKPGHTHLCVRSNGIVFPLTGV